MSEKQNYPKFYQPFEGQPAPETKEQEETNRLFNELFDEYMLRHINGIQRHRDDLGFEAKLTLKLRIEHQKYDATFEENENADIENPLEFRDSDIFTRSIGVQREVGQHGRETWEYRLGKDGVVRKYDLGDQQDRNILDTIDQNHIDEARISQEAFLREVKYVTETIPNTLSNMHLEEDMGVNNQPVSLAEIQGLKEFLDSAEVLPA